MSAFIERITVFCFAASYGVALVLELWHLVAPRPILRLVGIGCGAAGLLAHTFYVLAQPLSLETPTGSLLLLAWILAVFYVYGSIHHIRQAWGLFVLPLVLGLVVLAVLAPPPREAEPTIWSDFDGNRFWGLIHGILVLLAGVGISVAFVASVMYLVQLRRLRAKRAPDAGMKMMSLERLEAMNRKAILWAFPLLTAGLIAGALLQWHQGQFLVGWDSPKIASALGLWIVFAILLYLRYGAHARGRQTAMLTLLAFAILICALLSPVHPFMRGGGGP
ncbi:MAG TPA: cytochrome c biogenesis protein CcsA [Gemmataceae bacterium]|jgi:ABC-type transport system involved in cytochrome c biogenesis permease subunit|nr:cytochrome c biogenesis protein CcsA [Gemmataceae bacterium]